MSFVSLSCNIALCHYARFFISPAKAVQEFFFVFAQPPPPPIQNKLVRPLQPSDGVHSVTLQELVLASSSCASRIQSRFWHLSGVSFKISDEHPHHIFVGMEQVFGIFGIFKGLGELNKYFDFTAQYFAGRETSERNLAGTSYKIPRRDELVS